MAEELSLNDGLPYKSPVHDTPGEEMVVVNSWDEVPHFASEEEAADWWDTHTLAKHLWSKRRGPPPGSLAERLLRERPRPGMFAVSSQEGLVSPDYGVFRAAAGSDVKYFEYLFRTPRYIDQFAQQQDAIVAFLAHFDRRINRLIRAKRRLIDLLNE